MSEVKWIKIATDVFNDDKILMIEGMPNSDSIIVIWFKLLCFAGQQNNEGVFLMNNRIAYTDEMLASIFRRPVNLVKVALKVFEGYGMIEIIDDVITIPNWNKYQTLDVYEKKKERDRLYQAERRAKQKELIEKSSDNRLTVVDESSDSRLTSDDKSSPVVVSEEDIDIEEDIDSLVQDINTACNILAEYEETTDSVFIEIPLKDGEMYPVMESYVVEMEKDHPLVDVRSEIKKMRAWSINNPSNRKTKRGVKRFIGGWLDRAEPKRETNQTIDLDAIRRKVGEIE